MSTFIKTIGYGILVIVSISFVGGLIYITALEQTKYNQTMQTNCTDKPESIEFKKNFWLGMQLQGCIHPKTIYTIYITGLQTKHPFDNITVQSKNNYFGYSIFQDEYTPSDTYTAYLYSNNNLLSSQKYTYFNPGIINMDIIKPLIPIIMLSIMVVLCLDICIVLKNKLLKKKSVE